jgi:GR25 family glycosyltransferase involved in LPS biosynthesis
LEKRSLFIDGWTNAKQGEVGVWLSNYDRWKLASMLDEPLIVFEDDAMPHPGFNLYMDDIFRDLPPDWDFMSLWIPDNQKIDYLYDIAFDDQGKHIFLNRPWKTNETSLYRVDNSNTVALAFQGYGMVSLMYSPTGANKLLHLSRETGLTGPVDCWLFQQAHRGLVQGYSCHPHFAHVVRYDNWEGISHVQQTDKAL